jgi:type II secretory pathway pseudopilin PulG
MTTQRGFTYLGLLIAIALLGIGLAAASEVWSLTAKRQRIEHLQWVGKQYVQAIGSYYESSPGSVKVFPRAFEDLIEDRRGPLVRRHLRQPYVNPLTGKFDWEVVGPPGTGIQGVRAPAPAGDPSPSPEFTYSPAR